MGSAAQAGIISSGAGTFFPGAPATGNVVDRNADAVLGNGGSVLIDGGSSAEIRSLTTSGSSLFTISGNPGGGFGQPNSQLDLFSNNDFRLVTRGNSTINVTNGGYLQTDAMGCVSVNCYNTMLGFGAGNTSTLNLNGGFGLFNQLTLANTSLANTSQGTPGGVARATINVTNGGQMVSNGQAILGSFGQTPNVNAPGESAVADILVSGAGSAWRVNPLFQSLPNTSPGVPNTFSQQAIVSVGASSNTTGTLTVNNGAQMVISGPPVSVPGFNSTPLMLVGTGGAGLNNTNATVNVSGAGSRLLFEGAAIMNIAGGAAAGSSAISTSNVMGTVNVSNGGYIGSTVNNGFNILQVGRGGTGTQGNMTITGTGSLVEVAGVLHPGSGGVANGALVNVGRDGSTGALTVSNGGALRITTLSPNAITPLTGPRMGIGTNAALGMGGSGAVTVTGAGSIITLEGDTFNPSITLGNASTGSLSILNGGVVRMIGPAGNNPISGTNPILVNVGGTNTTGAASTVGTGTLTVSGTGSTLDMTGVNNRFIGVGRNAGSNGTLNLGTGGTINTGSVSIGDGGSGVMNMSGGTLNLGGVNAASSSGGLSVGRAGGTGTVAMSGGQINVANPVGGIGIGGSSLFAGGGTGTMTMSNGAQIVYSATGTPGMSVGQAGGTGTLVMTGTGTAITMNGGNLTIGSSTGSNGSIQVGAGASITGVNNLRIAHDGTNSVGAGSLKVNGLVSATQIINGANGLITGSGTLQGNLTNFGTINPGNSPGTLRIEGILDNQGGKIILEVQETAPGVFVTDKIVLAAGSVLDLMNTQIEFQFLGSTNAAAFAAQGPGAGIELETFFGRETAPGVVGALSALDLAEFTSALFSSSTDNSSGGSSGLPVFDVSVGGTTIANTADVPLPGTLVLIGGGLWLMRRRNRQPAN